MKNLQIDYLLQRKKETGIETKVVSLSYRNKKIKHFYCVNPLDKLLVKQIITKEQHSAGRQYQIDFELANKSNHAKMNYNLVLGDNTKLVIIEPREEELRARKNVELIKQILRDKEEEFKKVSLILKKRYRPKNYLTILELLIEKEVALSLVSSGIGFHKRNLEVIKIRTGEILDIIENYYNN